MAKRLSSTQPRKFGSRKPTRTLTRREISQLARRLLGVKVECEYLAPAITCESNGRRVRYVGKVVQIVHNPTVYFGENTLVVQHETGARNYMRLKNVRRIKGESGRWRKYDWEQETLKRMQEKYLEQQ